jgi:hypothetical protein
VKTLEDGTETKWCERCNRWTSGKFLHSTAEHKTKAELATEKSATADSAPPVANMAREHPSESDGLRLIRGFMLGTPVNLDETNDDWTTIAAKGQSGR